jgi:hypothetical protein
MKFGIVVISILLISSVISCIANIEEFFDDDYDYLYLITL